jgi:hypothetical protein
MVTLPFTLTTVVTSQNLHRLAHGSVDSSPHARASRGSRASLRSHAPDGTYTAMLARLAKLDVLVLDDFLIAPLKDAERGQPERVPGSRRDERPDRAEYADTWV